MNSSVAATLLGPKSNQQFLMICEAIQTDDKMINAIRDKNTVIISDKIVENYYFNNKKN